MNWEFFRPSPKNANEGKINRPKNFNKMVEIAKSLSKDFPFVRVDFYEIEDKIYLGEMTFYPNGGYNAYYPEWDYKIGSWLILPNEKE